MHVLWLVILEILCLLFKILLIGHIKIFDTAIFFLVQLYPGTQAYIDAKRQGQLKPKDYRDWIPSNGLHAMTLTENDKGLTSQQIVEFCDSARKRFYLRKRYIFKKSLQLF